MITGSNVAIVTPFTDAGIEVNYSQLEALIEWQIASGTAGIVPAGTTGEAATMSHEEQIEVIRFTVKTVAGRAKVIAGTGSNNTTEALRLTQAAKDAGVDAALIVSPYYNKPTPEGLFLHYQALAKIGVPIVLYNVPSRTGSKMSPETIARLFNELDTVVAVKEATGDIDQACRIHQLCPDLPILSGDDGLLLPLMSVGAVGVISVAANVVPQEMKALCNAALAGDFAKAREIHYQLLPLFAALFVETNPIPVKTALVCMGRINEQMRLPLCPISEAGKAVLTEAMKAVGCCEKTVAAGK